MRTIWKEEIPIESHIIVSLPKEAEVLTVQIQDNRPFIWFVCDPEAEKEHKRFRLLSTGEKIAPMLGDYIGSFQISGWEMYHLFEI